jgi:hypothetical protein
MSDTRGSNQSRDPAPRRAEASATAGAGNQQAPQERTSAATQYWQGVAAAGRAAKPAAAQAEATPPARQRGLRA